MKVVAIVVTYNRKELLTECLQAILNQTYPVAQILVINNASTDGTAEMFEEGGVFFLPFVKCYTMDSNLGGAGGFSEGIKLAAKEESDWVWIMDDDTIPKSNALEQFIQCIENINDKSISFLASSVFGMDGEPMNVPIINHELHSNGYGQWYEYLEHGMIKIEAATFVSILVRTDAVKKVGIPFKDYFLWGDDIEYTKRLVKYYGDAYMCGTSKVIHKRINAKALSIFSEDNPNRAKLYFYYFRNNLINCKAYSTKTAVFIRIMRYCWKSIQVLYKPKVSYRCIKFCAIQKGIWHFLLKQYNSCNFENRIGNFE